MTTILVVFGGLSIGASIFTIAACMLSSKISQRECQEEQYNSQLELPTIPVIEVNS